MVRFSSLATAVLIVAPSVGAQSIPSSVQAAEAEGASYSSASAPAHVSFAFTSAYAGTAARKCTTLPSTGATNGALRSGEIVIRGGPRVHPFGSPGYLDGPWDIKANHTFKLLWLPLHNPFDYPDTLLIRAVRLDSPTDTLRQQVAGWGYSPGNERESGFPSLVMFPSAGEWLVIATAGPDWSCFVLAVSSA